EVTTEPRFAFVHRSFQPQSYSMPPLIAWEPVTYVAFNPRSRYGYHVQFVFAPALRNVVTPRKLAGAFCAVTRTSDGSPPSFANRFPQPSIRSTAVASSSSLFVTGDDQLTKAICCGRYMKFTAASGDVPADPRFGHWQRSR